MPGRKVLEIIKAAFYTKAKLAAEVSFLKDRNNFLNNMLKDVEGIISNSIDSNARMMSLALAKKEFIQNTKS